MKEPILKGMKPGELLGLTLLVFIVAGLLFYALALGLASLFFGLPLNEVLGMSDFSAEENLGVLKFIQLITGAGNYIFAAVLISKMITGGWFEFFRGENRLSLVAIFLVIVLIVAAIPLVNFATELNLKLRLPFGELQAVMERMESEAARITWSLTSADSGWGLALNLLMIALIPGIGEELIFRGLVQNIFTRWFRNGHFAIILTAVIFSALHLQFLSFLPRFLLGLILGYLFYYGKSIWYPIVAHAVNNTMGVIFYYFAHGDATVQGWDELGTSSKLHWSAAVSFVILLLVFLLWLKTVRVFSQGPQGGRLRKD